MTYCAVLTSVDSNDVLYIVRKYYIFIGEFLTYRVLAHLEPYFQFQRNLFNKLTSMTPQANNTCRKLRVSAF